MTITSLPRTVRLTRDDADNADTDARPVWAALAHVTADDAGRLMDDGLDMMAAEREIEDLLRRDGGAAFLRYVARDGYETIVLACRDRVHTIYAAKLG